MHSYPIPNSIASTFGLTTCGLVFIPNIPVCIPFYVSPYIHSHPIKPLVFLAKSSLNVAAGAGSVYIPAYTYIYIFFSFLPGQLRPSLAQLRPSLPYIYICIYIYACVYNISIYICVYKLYLIYFDIVHLYIYTHISHIYIPAWSATTIPSYIYIHIYTYLYIYFHSRLVSDGQVPMGGIPAPKQGIILA